LSDSQKRILALEPYYGGSHKAWIDAWKAQSRHKIELLTLPARKWKWRMRGAAIELADRIRRDDRGISWDGLIASDMMNLAEFLALTRPVFDRVPAVLYLHENQISYPLQEGEIIDYHYAITNLVSILAATKVVFNSVYNRQNFFDGIRKILAKMPDFKPAPERLTQFERESLVIAPGVDFSGLDISRSRYDGGPPVILWNHRWEHDKQPHVFVGALRELIKRNVTFQVIICGERFRDIPDCFATARELLGERLIHLGYVPSRREYAELLTQSDIVVSTATQEFFGISIVEAIYAGAFPVLPNRLNYPHLIPESSHDWALYEEGKLVYVLERVLRRFRETGLANLKACVEGYGWPCLIERYDALFDRD